MNIQIVAVANTDTHEVYADDLRIGFVKLDANSAKSISPWRALQWRHRQIGRFIDQQTAVDAVVNHYSDLFLRCAELSDKAKVDRSLIPRAKNLERQVRLFGENAVRLKR
jgi:hypothetical protein